MRLNPNLVPWMTVMGLLGMGLAYGVSLMMGWTQPMNAAFYGLSAGVFVGLIFRLVFRARSSHGATKTGGEARDSAKPAKDSEESSGTAS